MQSNSIVVVWKENKTVLLVCADRWSLCSSFFFPFPCASSVSLPCAPVFVSLLSVVGCVFLGVAIPLTRYLVTKNMSSFPRSSTSQTNCWFSSARHKHIIITFCVLERLGNEQTPQQHGQNTSYIQYMFHILF